jgi:hypothetical protein
VNAKSNKSKPQKSRRDSRRLASAPRSSRPDAEATAAAAPPRDHSENTPMEEHSEIVRREARTTRPGTGASDDPPATSRGVGLTVTDKSLRPSVLRWKSWQVSDSFREYAERAARGEKLPRFEGSILADPSRMLPAPSPDQSETSLRRAYGIKGPRPPLMNPDSWVWNPWIWAASATVFAISLFGATLWYTTPRDEVVWDTAALTPAPGPQTSARAAKREPTRAVIEPRIEEPLIAPVPSVVASAQAQKAPSAAPAAARVAALPRPALPRPAPPPLVAPPLAQAPVTITTVESTTAAVAPLAKTAPVERTGAELDALLQGLEAQSGTGPTSRAPTATYPAQLEAPAAAASAAPAAAAPAARESDSLLVEAPSF